ncbi:5-formyltetrahydrofolate cyclo-ligase [Streptomyces sp. XM4193]|uniref:5-formyltetrahydrofolate cyclo-ligase n=1 Tax=Streptomyces sp. XM4193 TaxID=2929782 RepID=UPI001FF979BC|nr:5-formyltetrahydrofolate cyclo-ligase [Streptomyces sp. XM4193]MCK1796798.1 5-formyltetrahydrofolate cyclo-ligase [Streptomyces sp. XM4193]
MSSEGSKRALRAELLSVRRKLTPDDVRLRAERIAAAAARWDRLAEARTVAGYVSVGTEPGTRALLDALRERGTRVLLPVLLPDNDLDWAAYEGPERLLPAGRGLLEPAGERLGAEAVADSEVVLLPGLAVDRSGLRLGRGGGSYDRVLARLAAAGADPALVVLLYDDEVLARVPAEPHDRPVHAVVTPSGLLRF